jgi:hypothetical protein
MVFQDGARWDTLTNCVIAGAGAALHLAAARGPILIDHCTFAGFSPWRGTIGLDTGPWVGTMTLTNNIFYTAHGSPRAKEYAPLFTNFNAVNGHLISNNNLFYSKMSRDSSIFCWNVGGGNSAPGAGKPWHSATGQDANSISASPRFDDSSSVRNFDAHLRAGSPAIGRGSGGSDIGAYPFGGGPGPDVTPPAAVGDLDDVLFSDTSVMLRWTATGDDGLVGQAAGYDLRWSTSPINAANFSSATRATVSPPGVSGSVQDHTVSGLVANSTYYFALKVGDEAGNWSPISNVVQITTHDRVPPATINDLRVNP